MGFHLLHVGLHCLCGIFQMTFQHVNTAVSFPGLLLPNESNFPQMHSALLVSVWPNKQPPLLNTLSTEADVHGARRRYSQTMAFEWQTAFVVSHKISWRALLTAVKNYNKSLENSRTFSARARPRQQDQDFMIHDQDQDFHFCPRGVSRPKRPWTRVLHHCMQLHVMDRSDTAVLPLCRQILGFIVWYTQKSGASDGLARDLHSAELFLAEDVRVGKLCGTHTTSAQQYCFFLKTWVQVNCVAHSFPTHTNSTRNSCSAVLRKQRTSQNGRLTSATTISSCCSSRHQTSVSHQIASACLLARLKPVI